MRVTLYYNPMQGGMKNIYFKHKNKFYRSGVVVNRLSDLNVEQHRENIRRAIDRMIKSGSLAKHAIENQGLVYSKTSLVLEDL